MGPVMTKQLPGPKSVIQFARFYCMETKCHSDRWTCRKAELKCTDMCDCCDIGEIRDNAEQVKAVNMYTDEEDKELQDDEEVEEMFIWIIYGYLNILNYHFPMFKKVFT